MPNHYSRASGKDWGEMFGLSPNDLDEAQLKKVNVEKLVELLDKDNRVEKILGNKLLKCKVDYITSLDSLEHYEISKYQYLLDMYNDTIRVRAKDIDEQYKKSYYSGAREKFVFWKFLDDVNKVNEVSRWIDKQMSVVSAEKIDFEWLYKTELCTQALRDSVVQRVVESEKGASRRRGEAGKAIIRLIEKLPEDQYLKHIDLIFECGNSVRAHALSNAYTPTKYIVKALRAISGKKNIPNVNVTLSKSLLSKLPTINRLGVLETLLRYSSCKVKFEDITTSSDLETLLFGSLIRHNARVSVVLEIFKRRYEPRPVP